MPISQINRLLFDVKARDFRDGFKTVVEVHQAFGIANGKKTIGLDIVI